MTSDYIEVTSSSEKDETKLQLKKDNTGKAMDMLKQLHVEMENTGLLIEERVDDIHKILLKDLHPDCGKIRETEAYTYWNEEKHEYPSAKDHIEKLLWTLIERHNIKIIEQLPKDDAETTEFIFKVCC